MSVFVEIRNRQGDAQVEYAALARTIAEGQHVDPDDVLKILERTGRTAEELEKAAAAIEARIIARRQLDEMPAAEAERERLRKLQADADALLAKAKTEHASSSRRIDADMSLVRLKISDASAAKRLLFQTAPPEARANLAGLQGRISEVLAARRQAEDRRKQLLVDVERAKEQRRSRIALPGIDRGDPIGDQITRMTAQITELTAEVARLDGELVQGKADVERAELVLLQA